jgi:RNA polymerase sigma-70 factor (ECF subfamily)
MKRWRLPARALLALALLSAEARAEVAVVGLEYRAPAECPERDVFVQALEARTTRVRTAAVGAQGTLFIELAAAPNEVHGAILFREANGRETERAVTAPNCSDDLAEDAAQEVFLIASDKLDRIDPAAERQFLYAVAVRVAANFRRSLGSRRELPLESYERELSADSAPDALVEQKRAREILDRILDSMPEDLRTAFVLFELEELTGPEVAEVLGVPLGTTASRLRRARELFRTSVARFRGAFESGGAP